MESLDEMRSSLSVLERLQVDMEYEGPEMSLKSIRKLEKLVGERERDLRKAEHEAYAFWTARGAR